ncbi:unnamed protein product [Calicophoron daubneyi]|uniref:Uncharacterized protein n=1 Tax=Calicophoron daubneyi TaxID=300641 RepID=A0AAV2U0C7_CALDB
MHATRYILVITCLCGMILGTPTETTTKNKNSYTVPSTLVRLAHWIKIHTRIYLNGILKGTPTETTTSNTQEIMGNQSGVVTIGSNLCDGLHLPDGIFASSLKSSPQ